MFVLRTLVWDQIKLPDDWLLQKSIPAIKKELSKLDIIITNSEGDVSIRFQKAIQRSFQISTGQVMMKWIKWLIGQGDYSYGLKQLLVSLSFGDTGLS